MSEVIFICNANMCRSAMAEGILRRNCTNAGLNITVASMGIHARDGRAATEFTVKVAGEFGIDLSAHQSRQIIPEELKASRLIFTMEPVQVDYLDIFFPQVSDRLFMLTSWPLRKEKKKGVSDPVGRSIEVHRKVFRSIDGHIERIFPDIISLFSTDFNR